MQHSYMRILQRQSMELQMRFKENITTKLEKLADVENRVQDLIKKLEPEVVTCPNNTCPNRYEKGIRTDERLNS